MVVGETAQLTATVYDQNGRVMHSDDITVVWDTNDHDVATLTQEGLLSAVAVGSCQVGAAILTPAADAFGLTVTAG